ncbi:acetyltransferase [Candidatus Poribacteria bacterium]|nr:acetyltransferase [Candidatus Poribacteria bacterium]
MSNIILIGAGGHAQSCIELIESSNMYKIAGLIDKNKNTPDLLGYPILGSDEDLIQIRLVYDTAIVAIGQIKTAKYRIKSFNYLNHLDFDLPILISPRAYVSPRAKIGKGTVVLHDVCINAGAVIGENCIINTKSIIEHNVKVGNHCHISTAAVLNGDVIVGARTFVGSGVTTKQSIVIGTDCVIGAGATVKKDITPNCLIRM